ncbi:MAG TPA: c-type cytochrome [Burkholderiales bacterium]|jgi:cytochrome c|nr:c-type cytochrome [Burkholderiales bacterium]
MRGITVLALAAALGWSMGASAQAPDEAAAQATLKASGCLRCHSVGADKDGPSFKKTAAKYKGQPGAAARLEGVLKSGTMKVDGKDVEHAAFKTKDDAAIKNAVAYILSR